jgi:hypothetical protein
MKRLLVAAFWGAFVFTLYMACHPQPPQPGGVSDKGLHILAFTVLTTLAVFAYPRTRLLRIGLLLALFGISIELIQLVPVLHRDGNIADLVADLIAISATLALATLHRNKSAAPIP